MTVGGSEMTKSNGNELELRRNFFPVRVTEHWPRLPVEIVECPSLETFLTLLAMFLCSLLLETLL